MICKRRSELKNTLLGILENVCTYSSLEREHWFAMNVYALRISLAEKALSREEKLDYFIPMHYVIRKYASKPKRVLAPLIPSMVFVRGKYSDVHNFQSIYSFIGFATMPKDGHRTPLVVPDPDMENFKIIALKAKGDLTYYRPEELRMQKGEYIRIIGGIFDGAVARLVKVSGKRNKKLVVELPGIADIATTSIEPQFVKKISLKEYKEALSGKAAGQGSPTNPACQPANPSHQPKTAETKRK